jgi:polysaccharide biosynthesis transport protein
MSQVQAIPPAPQRADPQPESFDLRAYTSAIWRWKWLVIGMAILAAAGTYALSSRQTKTYQSSTQLYVTNADPSAALSGVSAGLLTGTALADMAQLFTAQAITDSVYTKLGLQIGSAGSVVVSSSQTSDFLTVTATSRNPVLAARLATTYVDAFGAAQARSVVTAAQADAAAAQSALRAIPATTAANVAERSTLTARIAAYEADARNPTSGFRVTQPADVPTRPVTPKPVRDAVFVGVIGLLLGIGLAFLLDLPDRRLLRVSTVESLYGRSVLAVLPHVSNPAPRDLGSYLTPPEFVEVMRSLHMSLRLTASGPSGGPPLRSLIVTSALPFEGKSTCVRDLAFAFADAGDRVLLIDCDLRRPSLAGLFAVKPEFGLVHILRNEMSPAEVALTVFRTSQPSSNGSAGQAMPGDLRARGSITLITPGERVESPAALLSSQAMSDLLATAATQYDMVILDTSPILTVSDAVPLLGQVSTVLFVARLGMTTREAAEQLTDLGRRVPNMNLAGVVVNDMRDGYSHYSRYGYTDANPEAEPVAPAAAAHAPVGAIEAATRDDPLERDEAPSHEPSALEFDEAAYAPLISYDSPSSYDPASPYDAAA